ncbi:ATP-binding protein [Bacillus sp. 31A1R]|uniref:histidine kinase n=1 Tax=Robertmurraya mangrovi TaxID=3098077 RepID=A0ABU5IVX1_9BACI|nr:ATP-binding protein [Bacillus sp. 31A1R]MDZ5471302.1 ATP-binding protein [Bacillus sp. 31A1R]
MESYRNLESEANYISQRPIGFIFKFKKIDDDFIHTYAHGDLLSKLGLTPSMVENGTLFDVLPEDVAKQKQLFYQKAWNGETSNYEGNFNQTHYLAVLSPIFNNGEVVEVFGTVFDITREKQNERMVGKAEKLAALGQLAAGIAHEIRNPLTSLKGFSQILKERTTGQEAEYVAIMLEELNRIQNIVNEFMLLSKPQEHFILKEHYMNHLISHVIKILEPEITLNNMNIITCFSNDIYAQVDDSQLKQVLINLIQNAIDASSTKRSDIIIYLNEIDQVYYEIKIVDFGIGISEERQESLFQPFFTTKEKGTGLGLMVCKRIIEQHKGSIELISKEGFGTTVKIILPKKITEGAPSK